MGIIAHPTDFSAHEHRAVYMCKWINTNTHVSKHTTPREPAFSEIALLATLPLMTFEGSTLLSFA